MSQNKEFNVFYAGIGAKHPKPDPWVFAPIYKFKLKLITILSIIYISIFLIIETISFILLYNNKIDFILFEWITLGTLIVLIILFVISLILLYKYLNSFEYTVHGTEIIIKKGLINVTTTHIPFANITNIKIREGPFDRIFGIGSINIQTAAQQYKSFDKIKIEGIMIFREVAYFIDQQLLLVKSYIESLLMDPHKSKSSTFSTEFYEEFYRNLVDIKKLLEN